MMAFFTRSLPLLHIFLPFPVGFLASRLIYGWVNKAGLQSAGFSPTVAAILTTPLLVVAYYILAMTDFIHGSIKNELYRTSFKLVLFGPIILPLSLLLAIYLRGGFRRKKMFGIILCAAAVAVVILEFIGLGLLLSGS